MGAYDNPRMINDPRASAYASVSNQIAQTLSSIGDSYAEMRARGAAKVEKTKILNSKILNNIEINNSARVDKMEETFRKQNIPKEMWNQEIANQRFLFSGNEGTFRPDETVIMPGDADYIMGATTANYLKNTEANLTSEQRRQYDDIINTANSNVQKVLDITGKVGAEAQQITDYVNGNASDNDLMWGGYDDAGSLATQFTGQSMAHINTPGVATSYELTNNSRVYTHTIDQDNELVRDMDMTTSKLGNVKVEEVFDQERFKKTYVFTQTLPLDGEYDMLVNVAPKTNTAEVLEISGITNPKGGPKEGLLKEDIPFTLEQVNVFPTDVNGNQLSNRIQGSISSYLPENYILSNTSRSASAKATSVVQTLNNKELDAYLKRRHNLIIEDVPGYEDFFNGMTNDKKIEYVTSLEQNQNLKASTIGFKKRLITDSEVEQLLKAKGEGQESLQKIPERWPKDQDANTPEDIAKKTAWEVWRNKQHFMQEKQLTNQGNQEEAKEPTAWDNQLRWYNDKDYGTDSTVFYDVETGDGESQALTILSNPELKTQTGQTNRIIQTAPGLWQGQKAMFASGNVRYKNVGSPSPKNTFNTWLGTDL